MGFIWLLAFPPTSKTAISHSHCMFPLRSLYRAARSRTFITRWSHKSLGFRLVLLGLEFRYTCVVGGPEVFPFRE
ncbi:hypothetical protein C8J57DRAFT_1317937 [Mycena rebaudengoi]|nr:hypothetical protein C8J57DRAFT_1317937 [Mycena rebaudengoi]